MADLHGYQFSFTVTVYSLLGCTLLFLPAWFLFPKSEGALASAVEEDGGDLWGDEDDDEEAEAENEKRLAAIAAAHKAKKAAAGKLKVVIAMSKIVLDVKPWDDATDMTTTQGDQAVRAQTQQH